MSSDAMELMVDDIIEVGYMLSCEEVAWVFKEIRQGKHGKTYNGITPDMVIPAVKDFLDRRLRYMQNNRPIKGKVNVVKFLVDNNVIKEDLNYKKGDNMSLKDVVQEIKRLEDAK